MYFTSQPCGLRVHLDRFSNIHVSVSIFPIMDFLLSSHLNKKQTFPGNPSYCQLEVPESMHWAYPQTHNRNTIKIM